VQYYTPEFAKRWQRYARPVGGSWRCDETYIKVKAIWVYLYRAVDKAGKTVDFYLSRKRDVAAAKAFLRKAMRRQRTPTKITLDAYAASQINGSSDHCASFGRRERIAVEVSIVA
jgi:transposase-like protein